MGSVTRRCIPIAATPGLRVRDAATGWRAVEEEFSPHSDVVVLADAGLQALSNGRVAACTHEVARSDRRRLSLVYELRPSMEVGRTILEDAS